MEVELTTQFQLIFRQLTLEYNRYIMICNGKSMMRKIFLIQERMSQAEIILVVQMDNTATNYADQFYYIKHLFVC